MGIHLASKKDKFLESAQKFILKGQLDRAIKDYEQVVALDPKEIRHRQRLAELLVRAGRKEEAIGEYESIGKFYADNGYLLKAIAVYKQIQKIASDTIKITLTLASLNEKQGLSGNALAEYGVACAHYEKNGQLFEVLKIIEKMLAIDPENPTTCRKQAEILFARQEYDGAYKAFCQLAQLLAAKGSQAAAEEVSARIRGLFPDREQPALATLSPRQDEVVARTAIAEQRLTGQVKSLDPTLHEEAPSGDEIPLSFDDLLATEKQRPVEPSEWLETSPAVQLAESVEPPEVEWEEEICLAIDENEDDIDSATVEEPLAEEAVAPEGETDLSEVQFDENLSAGVPLSPGCEDEVEIELTSDFFGEPDDLFPPPEKSAAGATPVKYSWDGMYSESGMGQQQDAGDMETHYDLGIAYKEMGLYDDAIKEFENASRNPRRKVDCLTLQAVCFREKGDLDRAEQLLQGGIGQKGLADVELLGLKYELALLYETAGRLDEALRVYGEVQAVNPDFHEVGTKIAELRGGEESQEILELDFEDLDVIDEETDGSGGHKT
jgi:tetratricopeptide (TPR) repeat protein